MSAGLLEWLAVWGACDMLYHVANAAHALGRKFGRWLTEDQPPAKKPWPL